MWKAPTIRQGKVEKTNTVNFPVDHYSQWSFAQFGSNPFMFKVNQINGDYLDTTSSASQVLGSASHKAMRAYLGGDPDKATPADNGEAIKFGYDEGKLYLDSQYDGFIEYNTNIQNRAKLEERYSFAYFEYIKEYNIQNEAKEILLIEKKLKHTIEIDGKLLPVPLKGIPDVVWRDSKGRIVIDDHKFTSNYSPESDIDGEKLLQAIFLFLLVAAETGEVPHRCRFREFKVIPNRDHSPQTRSFELVYEEIPEAFDLFYRYYDDVTNALLGHQVFVPNLKAMFDKEVSILAYIHRLDIDVERAKKFKEMKVENITDFLKKKIQKDGSMKKYLETVATKFISANTLNYKEMKIEDRIKMKLAEHGLGVEFDSMVVGPSVTLYRFEPSIGLKMSKIEAYGKDIEQVTEVSGIRILAPLADSGLVGFEIPNKVRSFPTDIPENTGFEIAVGQTIIGDVCTVDIRTAPHILIAGASGSGKSVWLNATIPQLAKLGDLHLFDPKIVELAQFDSIAKEYESDADKINESLNDLVIEMEARYKKLSKLGKKNIEGTKIPYKFVVIDEFGDLATQNPEGYERWELCDKHAQWNDKQGGLLQNLLATTRKLRVREQEIVDSVYFCEDCVRHIVPGFEHSLLRLASKGRAAGIHLLIATQSPRASIINGKIKANFPVKVLFKTSKAIDSTIVIDEVGGEKLLGKGDMLFCGPTGSIQRLQGFNV